MDEEEQEELEPTVDPLYLSHFREVLHQTQTHLSGHTTDPIPPSFVPPTGYWSSHEKDLFFHALCIHSRLRPDLVAECVKTKSIADVCDYMRLLDEYLLETDNRGARVERRQIPAAMEVSPKWIQFEEDKAAEILTAEPSWDIEAHNHRREADLTIQQRFLRGKARNDLEDRQAELWEKEDSLRSLDDHDLIALGFILRDAEAGENASEIASRSRQSAAPQNVPTLVHADEAMIDPELSKISRPPSPHVPATPSRAASPSPDSSTIPADLSPGSRRRFQKRLYMRRKRAQAAGREVDEDTLRLKPGRQAKKIKPSPHAMDIDDAEDVEYRHPNPSGKTVAYKTLTKFSDLKVDANMLSELGLDLFHLGTLPKLMKLYAQMHGDDSTVGTQISYDTIRILQAHTIRFVTDLVQRTIVLREQDLVLKSHTKVWKDKQIVTKEHIDSALEFVFSERVDKEQYFEKILGRLHSAEASESEASDGDDDATREKDGDGYVEDNENYSIPSSSGAEPDSPISDDKTGAIPGLTTLRSIYTPFIHLSAASDDLMTEDSDEEDRAALQIQEDLDLDKMDCMLDDMHEKGLWERFVYARSRVLPSAFKLDPPEPDERSFEDDSPRGRAHTQDRQFKSRAVISDSD